jgi:hypothetical protein
MRLVKKLELANNLITKVKRVFEHYLLQTGFSIFTILLILKLSLSGTWTNKTNMRFMLKMRLWPEIYQLNIQQEDWQFHAGYY